MSLEYIANKGAQLVKRCDTRDPFKIAKELGIKVMFVVEFEKLKGLDHFIINCVRKGRHISHFSLEGALEVAAKVGAKHTWLTHLSHQLPKQEVLEKELPAGIMPAYDGLVLFCD